MELFGKQDCPAMQVSPWVEKVLSGNSALPRPGPLCNVNFPYKNVTSSPVFRASPVSAVS